MAAQAIEGCGFSVSISIVVILASRLGKDAQQSTIALEAGVNPAALVRTLDQAQEAGLLLRRDVPGNRRCKVVELLPKGKKLARKIEALLAQARRDVLSDIPVGDIATAMRVLRTLEARALDYLKEDRHA